MIFARILGVLLVAPVFSRKEIFGFSKIVLLFWMSGLLMYLIPISQELPEHVLPTVLAFVTEFSVGFLIGFTLDILVIGWEFAGSLMDTQAGLSVASLLDPSTGHNITLMSLLLKWTALIVFLQIDGHHLILSAIVQSFKVIPLACPVNLSAGCQELLKVGSYMFYLGVQLSAPILLVVFLIDFGMGMLNKLAEQVNVFQLGFQVKPSVSLLIFLTTSPGIVGSIYLVLQHITDVLLKVFYALQLPVSPT